MNAFSEAKKQPLFRPKINYKNAREKWGENLEGIYKCITLVKELKNKSMERDNKLTERDYYLIGILIAIILHGLALLLVVINNILK